MVQLETGAMTFMDTDVHMKTTTGGLLKGLKRMLAGESLFITRFHNPTQRPLSVAFASAFPGKIIPLDLNQVGGAFLAQRTSFLVATSQVDISIAFTRRLGTGLFGGDGFILQRFEGTGLAFLNAGGATVEKDLAPGEVLKVWIPGASWGLRPPWITTSSSSRGSRTSSSEARASFWGWCAVPGGYTSKACPSPDSRGPHPLRRASFGGRGAWGCGAGGRAPQGVAERELARGGKGVSREPIGGEVRIMGGRLRRRYGPWT